MNTSQLTGGCVAQHEVRVAAGPSFYAKKGNCFFLFFPRPKWGRTF